MVALFPLLGFLDNFWFFSTYVLDYFQYLPSLGIIVLVSAGLALLLERCGIWRRPAGHGVCLAILVMLGILT